MSGTVVILDGSDDDAEGHKRPREPEPSQAMAPERPPLTEEETPRGFFMLVCRDGSRAVLRAAMVIGLLDPDASDKNQTGCGVMYSNGQTLGAMAGLNEVSVRLARALEAEASESRGF